MAEDKTSGLDLVRDCFLDLTIFFQTFLYEIFLFSWLIYFRFHPFYLPKSQNSLEKNSLNQGSNCQLNPGQMSCPLSQVHRSSFGITVLPKLLQWQIKNIATLFGEICSGNKSMTLDKSSFWSQKRKKSSTQPCSI